MSRRQRGGVYVRQVMERDLLAGRSHAEIMKQVKEDVRKSGDDGASA